MLRRLTSYHYSIIAAFILSLSFAVVFLFWHPSPENDLFAYFSWMDIMRALEPDRLWHFIVSRGEFITMGYMYVVAKLGVYGLFQFFPSFLSLFIVQYVTLSYCRIRDLPLKYAWVGIFAFLAMYELFLIPSGVRSTIGFALISLALYLEFVLGKKNARWLYVTATLIHLGMIIPALIRLFMSIPSTKFKRLVIAIVVCLSVLPIGYVLTALTEGSSDIVSVNLYKLGYYMEYFAPWSGPYVYKIAKAIIMLFVCWRLYKADSADKYGQFYLYAAALTVVLFGHYLLWYRLLELVLIGSPLLFARLVNLVKSTGDRALVIGWCGAIVLLTLVGIRIQIVYFESDDFKLYDTIPMYDSRAY